jgi:DNA-binding MarR family transcriptional regulator
MRQPGLAAAHSGEDIGPDDSTLAELVTTLAGRLRAAWRDGLSPWGLSPHQGRALLVIALRPGLRSTDLADRLRIAPRSVTEVVDGLVEAGLVERRPDPDDRRAMSLHITTEGGGLVEQIQKSREQVADTLFDRLSAQDQATLHRLLRAVVGEEDDLHRHSRHRPS